MDLLASGVEPGPGNSEFGTVVSKGEAHHLGVKGDGGWDVVDVEGDVVDALRGVRHGSDPTTWRTIEATVGAALAATSTRSSEGPAEGLVTTPSPRTHAPA